MVESEVFMKLCIKIKFEEEKTSAKRKQHNECNKVIRTLNGLFKYFVFRGRKEQQYLVGTYFVLMWCLLQACWYYNKIKNTESNNKHITPMEESEKKMLPTHVHYVSVLYPAEQNTLRKTAGLKPDNNYFIKLFFSLWFRPISHTKFWK